MSKPRNSPVEEVTSARELLALNMIRLRTQKGWTQEALALEADIDRTFVAHVERHKRNISLDNIERIAVALDVPIRDLFTPPRRSRAG